MVLDISSAKIIIRMVTRIIVILIVLWVADIFLSKKQVGKITKIMLIAVGVSMILMSLLALILFVIGISTSYKSMIIKYGMTLHITMLIFLILFSGSLIILGGKVINYAFKHQVLKTK